jgi:ubiquinone/menaquinone biosynthesis C-methylase UbiE
MTINFNASHSYNTGHTSNGTNYGKKGVVAYAESNHGPDGRIFLDPFFKSAIENLHNDTVLDVGCGAAPWSIYAAKNGGLAYGIDIQEEMIEEAKKAVSSANLSERVSLMVGDAANLPFEASFFDKEISICVGCNLPPEIFKKHFQECSRTLKPEGVIIVGAPISLGTVFTHGSKPKSETLKNIEEMLAALPDNPSSELIAEQLTQLKEVTSATFYFKDNRLALVTDTTVLKEGEMIWRKLPKLAIPNRYYSQEHYLETFEACGLRIEKIELPHFQNWEEMTTYNADCINDSDVLGPEYINHPPFVIFHLSKKEDLSAQPACRKASDAALALQNLTVKY